MCLRRARVRFLLSLSERKAWSNCSRGLQETQRLVTLYWKDWTCSVTSIRLDTALCNCRLRSVMSRRMQQTRNKNLLQNRMVVQCWNSIYGTKATCLKTCGQKYIMTTLNVFSKVRADCIYTQLTSLPRIYWLYNIQGDSFGTRPKKMRISQRLFIIQFNIL
jgi:hypothetical protein